MDKKKITIVVVAVVAVVVAILAVLVWPTPYRYERCNEGLGMIRIHRFSSQVDLLLVDGGWVNLKNIVYGSPPSPPEQKPMSSATAPEPAPH